MKSKNNNTLVLLIACLALVGIGYAYIQSTLSINGTATVDSASWNIHFENVNVIDGSVDAIEAPTVDTEKTSLTYNVKLSKPGDFYEFTLDVKNAGNIDGMIDAIASKYNGTVIGENTLPAYLRYSATYYDGLELSKNQLLKQGDSEKLKVRIEFREDINASDLPKTAQSISLAFELTYRQANQDGIKVVHPVYVVTTEDMHIGETINDRILFRSTASEAIADWESILGEGNTRPYYLKQKLNQEEIIEESYVEFIITEEMAAANKGMKAGTYAIRGGVEELEEEERPVYEANKEVLLTAFGSELCEFDHNEILCKVSEFEAYSDYWGNDYVNGYDQHCCYIYSDLEHTSHCY